MRKRLAQALKDTAMPNGQRSCTIIVHYMTQSGIFIARGICNVGAPRGKKTTYLESIQEDTKGPIALLVQEEEASEVLQEADAAYNRFALCEREAHGRRVKIRLDWSVYARQRSGGLGFVRLRNKHALFSAPNARQAQAVIELLLKVCAQLDGKFLAESEE
jgi:hypothetical protein